MYALYSTSNLVDFLILFSFVCLAAMSGPVRVRRNDMSENSAVELFSLSLYAFSLSASQIASLVFIWKPSTLYSLSLATLPLPTYIPCQWPIYSI